MAMATVATTRSGSTIRNGTRKISSTSGAGSRSTSAAKDCLKRAHGMNPASVRPTATKASHTQATAKNTIASASRAVRLTLKRFIPTRIPLFLATIHVHDRVMMPIKRGERKAFCAAIWPLIRC